MMVNARSKIKILFTLNKFQSKTLKYTNKKLKKNNWNLRYINCGAWQ